MEFNLIDEYFTWGYLNKDIIIGIGDDCAITYNNQKLAISTDSFIEGVHFFKGLDAGDIAYKALAVNLSDLAAMGAVPKYFTLALTLPNFDKNWLKKFSLSLKKIAQKYNIDLIGGDTTKGNLSITITVIGECQNPITRDGAKVGDGIFVSGDLGGAKLCLEMIKNKQKPNLKTLNKLQKPIPQIKLGQQLINIANSCIDISDGLATDLGHILKKSKVGANLNSVKIPIFPNSNLNYALFGGDDYQLCFTADNISVQDYKNITQIGEITYNKNLRVDGKLIDTKGYLHF